MSKIFKKIFLVNTVIVLSCLFILDPLVEVPTKNYFLLFLLSLVMAAVISVAIDVLFIRPVEKIKEAAYKMTSGHLAGRPSIQTGDEFHDLADNLNQISADLQHKILESTKDEYELRAILSSMVEGVILIGKDEKILLLSPAVSQMLDLRSREAIGKPYWEVIRNGEINAVLSETINQRKAIRKEVMILFPSESYFSLQVSPVLGEDRPDNFFGLVAVFHDITELKKLERVRSEFVANVSHELKTPLTSIKGFVETLKSGALEDAKTARRFLDIIQSHTERLENLVTDLLSLSALESKEATLNIEGISVGQLIESVSSLYKSQMDKKHQNFSFHIPDHLPPLFADKEKMEQVFSNLLDNAVKFTADGGQITIFVNEENGVIRIDVQDAGIGIASDHLSRIFERFYRVDKGRSRELGGTGLGLAIVKHIIQAHHGKITVQSDPNKGSTFSIFLPQRHF